MAIRQHTQAKNVYKNGLGQLLLPVQYRFWLQIFDTQKGGEGLTDPVGIYTCLREALQTSKQDTTSTSISVTVHSGGTDGCKAIYRSIPSVITIHGLVASLVG